MADEDFQSRVARIFGSLAFSRSSPSPTVSTSSSAPPAPRQQSGSVWSLSDSDVEKREWKRENLSSYDRDEMPCASSFDELLRQQKISSNGQKSLEDLDCGEEDDRVEGGNEGFDGDWSIRGSMGLDRTLDDEEEEDEFDKVALGKESGGEGLSILKDVVFNSSCGRIRDPRANYLAAQIRLKEDEIEARKLSASGDQSSRSKEPPHSEESSKAVPPKPILKRKENSSDAEARTSKRVRFDFVSEETSKKPEDTCTAPASIKSGFLQGKTDPRVPDYLRNPSKYTCYTFDPSSESNKKSATQEYMDIPEPVEGTTTTSEPESLEKVSFIPQNKTKDLKEDSSNCSETKPVVAEQLSEDERPSATEDGDNEIEESESSTSFQRKGRQYRAKQSLDETDV